MREPQILIAGIGNIFFGDDAFGCEVAKKLCAENLFPNVKIVDFGIKVRDLAFEIGGDYELIIVIDAVRRGGAAGTVYLLDLSDEATAAPNVLSAHDLKLAEAIVFARQIGAKPNKMLLVGGEAESFTGDELSSSVNGAVEKAVTLIKKIIAEEYDNAIESRTK